MKIENSLDEMIQLRKKHISELETTGKCPYPDDVEEKCHSPESKLLFLYKALNGYLLMKAALNDPKIRELIEKNKGNADEN
jgi:hypothetical protein